MNELSIGLKISILLGVISMIGIHLYDVIKVTGRRKSKLDTLSLILEVVVLVILTISVFS